MTTPHDPAQPTPEQPAYYGQPPAQYYAPKSPPSRGAWFAIGAASMFGFVLFGGLALFAYLNWALGDDYEDYAEEGDYYHVEQAAVIEAVDQPCVAMQDAAKKIVLIGGTDEGAASLKALSASIGDIVTAINGAKPNEDARKWRDDWIDISTSIDTYSAALSAGKPADLKLPRTAAGPVTDRMYGGAGGCELPMRVLILDSELTDEYYGY